MIWISILFTTRDSLIMFDCLLVSRWREWQVGDVEFNYGNRELEYEFSEYHLAKVGIRCSQRPRRRVLQIGKSYKPWGIRFLIDFVCFFCNRVAWLLKSSTTSRTLTSCLQWLQGSCTPNAKSKRFRSTCGIPGSRRSSKKSMIFRNEQLRLQHVPSLSWNACKLQFFQLEGADDDFIFLCATTATTSW